MPVLNLLHKCFQPVRQFGCKDIVIEAAQRVTENERHLLLREVQAVGNPFCPLEIALLHGVCSLPCIARVNTR